MIVPVKFRKGGEAIQGTYSFFSTLGGIGYVKVYLAGGTIEANTKDYYATLDNSISSDHDNYFTDGNVDLDFDLDIEKSFKIKAADAVMCWCQLNGGGQSCQVTWNIYHVDAAGVETLLGTANGDTYTNASSAAVRKAIRITMKAKSFKKGEKLRINAVQTASAGSGLRYDPAGRAVGGTAFSNTGDSFLSLPVELPI